MPVRLLRSDEITLCQEIGVDAGQRFREAGLDEVADDPPLETESLAAWQAAGRAWVSCENDEPVGFAVVDIVDGCAHIEEVSVRPEHNGRGHGSALIDVVREWSRRTGLVAVTLTTFNDVPFNRPYYERRGFRVLAPGELTPGLRARRQEESAKGLDPERRVCMRLDL